MTSISLSTAHASIPVLSVAAEPSVEALSPRIGAIFQGSFDLYIPPIPGYTRWVPYKWDDGNFLKRVPESERDAVRTVIQQELSQPQSKIHDVANILTINPDSPIGYREKTAQVLHHYLEGNINASQATRLLLYEACRAHVATAPSGSIAATPVEIHALVGQQSKQSFELLRKGYPHLLDEEDWECLKTALRENPNEPWDFFTITYPAKKCYGSLEAGLAGLLYVFIYNAYLIGYIPHVADPALPSPMTALAVPPRLWEHMMQARFGDQTMRMDLGLGYSPIETFSKLKSRMAGVPCVFVKTQTYLHEIIRADLLAEYFHDCYHNLIESANPHRALWIKIALLFKPLDLEKFVGLIDREFTDYVFGGWNKQQNVQPKARHEKHYARPPEQNFWRTLARHITPSKYPSLLIPILDLIRSHHPFLMETAEISLILCLITDFPFNKYNTPSMEAAVEWLEVIEEPQRYADRPPKKEEPEEEYDYYAEFGW